MLKMDETDLRDLGIKAQGHIVKFRQAIEKLIKINESQNRNRRIENRLMAIRTHNLQQPHQNMIRWDSSAQDEADHELGDDKDDSYEFDDELKSKASDQSQKNTSRTSSGFNSERRKLGSIDVSNFSPKNRPRKSSECINDRPLSDEQARSTDAESRKDPLMTQIPLDRKSVV